MAHTMLTEAVYDHYFAIYGFALFHVITTKAQRTVFHQWSSVQLSVSNRFPTIQQQDRHIPVRLSFPFQEYLQQDRRVQR